MKTFPDDFNCVRNLCLHKSAGIEQLHSLHMNIPIVSWCYFTWLVAIASGLALGKVFRKSCAKLQLSLEKETDRGWLIVSNKGF